MRGDYNQVKALVTGHTGFKGAWLSEWLKRDGAIVAGLALPPETNPNLFEAARIAEGMTSLFGDIRDMRVVRSAMEETRPDIVFHLAAQPLVRRSYRDPIETFATNVLGTAHVLEASRQCPSVRALVCVTTDKVYENHEWMWGYREHDRLGGKDPYSASKAAAELVAESYMQTMMPLAGSLRMATARGGNVIGGGDWSDDRLVPDIVRAIAADKQIVLRNPKATRPWQHVLDLVRGYLVLGRRLLAGDDTCVGAWNFGPENGNEVDVETLFRAFIKDWGCAIAVEVKPSAMREAQMLRLDISKARVALGWEPVLGFPETIALTADWYRRHLGGEDAASLLAEQIAAYQAKFAV